jgi:hypothetical protein
MSKISLVLLTLFSSLLSSEQVAVRNEPRHHNVFENDNIRVLDVFIPPHGTTLFHVHNTPSVFTTFTKTMTGSQLLGKQHSSGVSVAGDSWYDSLATPRIHRVWNEDSSWFHVMDIELTGGKPHNNPPFLQNTSLQLSFSQPLVNGYQLKLSPGNNLQLPPSPVGYFLLSKGDALVEYSTDSYVQRRIMKSGHYIWIEPGSAFSIVPADKSPANFLLLQLK